MKRFSCHRPSPHSVVGAFTLLEILVAMSVLALLVLLVAQLLHSGNVLISSSTKRLSADSQAREVFSRFSRDLAGIPAWTNLDAVLSAQNESLYFYSEAPGYHASSNASDQSTLSLVGYRINAQAQLERLGKGLTWGQPAFLTYASSTETAALEASTLPGAWPAIVGSAPNFEGGSSDAYHTMAPGVFRMFCCLQMRDGTYTLTQAPSGRQGSFQDTAALILTIAVLDDYSLKVVEDTARLRDALPTPTQADLDGKMLPARLWQTAATDVTQFASQAQIPESVAARVRIYQRSFPLQDS